MHSSNEKTVLMQLLDIYVHPSHCPCENDASGLDSTASSLGNTNFVNCGLWVLPSRTHKIGGQKGPVLPSLKLQQPTQHSSWAALPLIVSGVIEVHFPLNLSTSSWWPHVVRICRNGPQSGSTMKYEVCQQYLTSIRITSMSDQSHKSCLWLLHLQMSKCNCLMKSLPLISI